MISLYAALLCIAGVHSDPSMKMTFDERCVDSKVAMEVEGREKLLAKIRTLCFGKSIESLRIDAPSPPKVVGLSVTQSVICESIGVRVPRVSD